MDKFIINGGKPLCGRITASGSKNAALPILFSTLLTDEECVLDRVPDLRDIKTTFNLLQHLGKKVEYSDGTALIRPLNRLGTSAPYDLVKQMRASVLVAGPLLARFGEARVSLPGGCAIGLRPVDLHLKGFEALGAQIAHERGDMVITAPRLHGAEIKLAFPSVGATENILMCAALVPGKTLIENAALEPEIDDLVTFLTAMGARIERQGSASYLVEGAAALHGARHSIIADRIETGTYLLAGAATGGTVEVENCEPAHLRVLLEKMTEAGVKIKTTANSIKAEMPLKRPKPVDVETKPHPGFPTDLQAPWMAFICRARGESRVVEEIFENRFMHVAELGRMGAGIVAHGREVVACGVPELSGTSVMSSDLRGGAALVIAALSAQGQSEVQRVYHIDRGYEKMEQKLAALGGDIQRVNPGPWK